MDKKILLRVFNAVLIAATVSLMSTGERVWAQVQCARVLSDSFVNSNFDPYKNLEKLMARMEDADLSQYDPRTVEFLRHAYAKNNVIVSMAQPSELRSYIANQGSDFRFENFWSGHTSNGLSLQPVRLAIEAVRLGTSISEYGKTSANQRPIYGYLQFDKFEGNPEVSSPRMPNQYGDDVWIFKKNKVNFSVTIGDSFQYSPTQNIGISKKFSIIKTGGSELVGFNIDANLDFGQIGENSAFTRFMPYTPKTVDIMINNRMLKRTRPLNDLASPFPQTSTLLENYYEAQIFAKSDTEVLSLAYVEAFIFKKQPPHGRFLEVLKTYKIKIFDGTQGPHPVLWSEEATGINFNTYQRVLLSLSDNELENLRLNKTQMEAAVEGWQFTNPSSLRGFNSRPIERLLKTPQGLNMLLKILNKAAAEGSEDFRRIDQYIAERPEIINSTFLKKLVLLSFEYPNSMAGHTISKNFDLIEKIVGTQLLEDAIMSSDSLGFSKALILDKMISMKKINRQKLLVFVSKLSVYDCTFFMSYVFPSIVRFYRPSVPVLIQKMMQTKAISSSDLANKKTFLAHFMQYLVENRSTDHSLDKMISEIMMSPWVSVYSFSHFKKIQDIKSFPYVETIFNKILQGNDYSLQYDLKQFLESQKNDPFFAQFIK